MFYRSKWFLLGAAGVLLVIVLLLPRPEGTQFTIKGDGSHAFLQAIQDHFKMVNPANNSSKEYTVEVIRPEAFKSPGKYLQETAENLSLKDIQVEYVNGLSPKGKRFLAVLAMLVFLFVAEPIPLEITAICIGVFLVIMGIGDVKDVWAPYMNPVVVFVMCCLIFAISLDKVGLTKRLGYFIVKKAGNSVTRFTFIITISLGLASSLMHDAAACAIGIVTMLPLMRAANIAPHSNTARFMLLSLAFACSTGGMGTLVGGGRNMVAAAFLLEFTGVEISFLDWIKYAMPVAIISVPVAVGVVWFVFRPDPKYKLPEFDEKLSAWSPIEKRTLIIIGITFLLWLTKEIHGIHYSVTGMLGVAALVIAGILEWEDIHKNLEWGTALFIFGGGIALGLAMGTSGAASYFAHLFFPLVQGGGWLVLFIGVAIFGALVTNAMANVAAAALILPIVIPMAQLEGVNPAVLALCLGMSTSFAMLLVIGCPPNAIAYSYRYFRASDLTKAGAVTTPILLLVLILAVTVWWKILGLV